MKGTRRSATRRWRAFCRAVADPRVTARALGFDKAERKRQQVAAMQAARSGWPMPPAAGKGRGAR